MTDKIKYRIDPKTGRPLHLLGDRAVVLNDDGSTVTDAPLNSTKRSNRR
jgi:hypothetical protein